MSLDPLTDMPTPSRKAGAFTFAALFAGESLLRALNVSVIPLQTYDLLGSNQRVSSVTTAVSIMVLLTTLSLPFIFRGLRRRWIYTFGIASLVTGALFFASYTVLGQIAGHYLRNTGASILGVTLSLYIMDHIKRTDLTTSEPIRLATSTISWVIGPFSGAWLYTHYGAWAPQLAVVVMGGVLFAGFWIAKLSDPKTLNTGTISGFNPLGNALRFFRQPRLRLAWAIAFARSCFWSGLFIYSPLLVLEGGLSKQAAGLFLSASQLVLPASLLYGRIARKWGVRPVIAACHAGMAIATAIAGYVGKDHINLSIGFLLFGALCATGLDGVGGIPFLRAVKPRQRREMTSVYRTYIEFSDLLPGFIFMGLLLYFDVGIVFITLSILMVFMAAISWRYLPKSM